MYVYIYISTYLRISTLCLPHCLQSPEFHLQLSELQRWMKQYSNLQLPPPVADDLLIPGDVWKET